MNNLMDVSELSSQDKKIQRFPHAFPQGLYRRHLPACVEPSSMRDLTNRHSPRFLKLQNKTVQFKIETDIVTTL